MNTMKRQNAAIFLLLLAMCITDALAQNATYSIPLATKESIVMG